MSTARVAAMIAAAALAATACSKEAKRKDPIIVPSRLDPAPPPEAATPVTAAPPAYAPFAPLGARRTPLAAIVAADAGADAASVTPSAPAPDPDLAIVDGARLQAARCFAPLATADAPASRSATLVVTVAPTGRVARTDVNATGPRGGPPEPQLFDCLRGVGNGLTFTSKDSKADGGRPSNLGGDVRSITIDVTVTATH